MNDLPRVEKVISAKSVSAAQSAPTKNAIYLMAGLVVAAMIAWLGFLGWAVYALIFWIIQMVSSTPH